MHPESGNMNDYLRSTEIIDWNNPDVLAKAKEIVKDTDNVLTKIRALYEWVRDEIPHSNDIKTDIVSLSASDVLETGTGTCYAKSHLLTSLLRANKIPAGFCYQLLQRDPPLKGLVIHGLNAVYLNNLNKWIRIDARGNTGSCNAQFNIEREQLAFPMDKDLGEIIYETIFTDPDVNVIQVLKNHDNLSEIWPHLPGHTGERKIKKFTSILYKEK